MDRMIGGVTMRVKGVTIALVMMIAMTGRAAMMNSAEKEWDGANEVLMTLGSTERCAMSGCETNHIYMKNMGKEA